MAKYEVIERFKDNDGTIYEVDERYPRPANKKIPVKRLTELSTEKNKYKRPFIKEVEEEKKEEQKVEEGKGD